MTILINFVAVAVLLVSGLLAIIRGFLREILSIAAWLIAATCAYIAYINFSDSGTLSLVLVVVGAFLVSLLLTSIVTIRISDMVLDSRIGSIDRSAGFAFGLFRGVVVLAIALLVFDWWTASQNRSEVLESSAAVQLIRSGLHSIGIGQLTSLPTPTPSETSPRQLSTKTVLGLALGLLVAIVSAFIKAGWPQYAAYTGIGIPLATFLLYVLFGIEIKDSITLYEITLLSPPFLIGAFVATISYKFSH